MLIKPLLNTLAFLWLVLSGQAISHPLDSFATDQYVDITMSSGVVSLIHRIEFAEIPTVAEFPKVDTNSDTTLSEEENSQYLKAIERVLANELVLTSNGQRIVFAYERGEVLLQEIPAPRLKVITAYKAALPLVPPSGIPLQFDIKHRAGARGDRQVRLLCSGFIKLGSVWSSEPQQPFGMAPPVITEATALVYGHTTRWSLLPSQIEHRPSLASIPSSSRALPLQPPDPFLSLNPRGFEIPSIAQGLEPPALERKSFPSLQRESILVPGAGEGTGKDSHSSEVSSSNDGADLSKAAAPEYAEGTSSKPSRETWADSQFRGLFTGNQGGGMSFLLFATLLSLIYGAAHAMEPGHGKTIVAAYLVGSNGTVFHAVLLALIVTFTHTFSVYILGLIALTNLDKVQGTYLPWLECGSWALIVVMGLVLFLRYYRAYLLGDLADPNYHTHGLGHGHSHAPHVHEQHSHDHEQEDHHEFEDHHHDGLDHGHHHHHPHDHSHSLDHGHSHPHTHGEGLEKAGEEGTGRVSYWNLLTLGVTGGIVPCPGALFVMMMALTSGRAAVGLYLITVFSTGLAVALMAVGIVMVRSRRFIDRYSPNSRFVQLLPVVSSIIILLVGTGFLINGLVKHGLLEIHLS